MMSGFDLCRLLRRAACALALALSGALAMEPAAAEPAYWDWFKFQETASEDWSFREVPDDEFQVIVRSRAPHSGEALRRIFVLYPRPSSAYDVAISKILNVFSEKGINAEFRIFNFKKDETRGQQALHLLDAGGYDLVFSMGSESTAWLYGHYAGGRVPVVSVCSKDPVLLGQAESYESGSGSNFAFTSLNMPVEAQMAYVHELKPALKNIAVLVNSKNISAMQTQAQPIYDYSRRQGIRVIKLEVQEPGHARDELQKLVADAVQTMRKNDPTLDSSVFWITGSTAVFKEIATINAHADRVPVLSVVPEVVRSGDESAVLSVGISFESNAHLAAIYGAEILAGRTRAGDLRIGVVSPPDIAINFRKAREIGLRIPFSFFESASYVYDYDGLRVRNNGRSVPPAMADAETR